MTTQIRIAVDQENNAETWWDAARNALKAGRNAERHTPAWTFARALPASCEPVVCQLLVSEAIVTTQDAAAFRAWAETLPGWSDGPEHAPHPFTFHDVG